MKWLTFDADGIEPRSRGTGHPFPHFGEEPSTGPEAKKGLD